MWEKFANLLQRLKRILLEISGWVCIAMAVLIFADVIGRSIFNNPIPSVYEISEELLMVIFIFFAMASASHIRVSLVTSRFSPRFKYFASLSNHCISMLFLGFIAWKSLEMTWISWSQSEISESYLNFPLYPGRMAVFIGFIVFTFTEFVAFVELIRKWKR